MTITKKQQIKMLDYLVSKLEPNYTQVEPKNRNVFSEILNFPINIETSYIKLKDTNGVESIILLVDRVYPHWSKSYYSPFAKLYSNINTTFNENIAVVFYKNGEDFFRSAAQRNYYKKEKDLGQKNYSNEEIHRMIMFRPEEIIISEKKRGKLQYYQPQSAMLDEGLVTYTFGEVIAEYGDRLINKGINIAQREYKRNKIWLERKYGDDNLMIKDGFLINT